MANAIRAEKGYTALKVTEKDGKFDTEPFGSVIAWNVEGSGPPKPITTNGTPDGDYVVGTPEGAFEFEGKTYRNRQAVLGAMGEKKSGTVQETGKPKTQQEADQAIVSGPPNQIPDIPLRASPIVPEGEVRVDDFNTVSAEDPRVKATEEKKQNAAEFKPEEGEGSDKGSEQQQAQRAGRKAK